jgi:myo-inositol-1(or 4)-monophosphatase
MSSDEQIVLDEVYKIAFAAAVKASELVLQYWPNPLNAHFDKSKVMEVFEKSDGTGNYATIADTEAEDLIIKMIQENPVLKDHEILAEESGGKKANSDYKWIIDPIDGTQNFRNGMTDYGISIGVIHNNEAVVGIIAMPGLGHILSARKGEGAKLLAMDGKELLDLTKIKYTEPLDKALISYDLGYTNRVEQMKSGIEKIADKIAYPVAYSGASAANYRVALGYVAAYFHQTPTKYDVAAATAIILEAGGVVTDMKGSPIDWNAETISYLGARTATIHQQLLELLNK